MRVIVADNDVDAKRAGSASNAAARRRCRSRSSMCIARPSNISIARNACLDNSDGDFLAFIDDDETGIGRMAGRSLLETAEATGADAVLGPGARRSIPTPRPRWMRRGDFHSTRPVCVGERDPHRLYLQCACCAAPRQPLPAAASTSRSARPAARTPNILPRCTRPAAASPLRRRPGCTNRCRMTAHAFSWLTKRRFRVGQTHGRLLGQQAFRGWLLPGSSALPPPRRPIASRLRL